ncbi:MAG TPA: NUDIX domain-containing protein [Candidatus Nanoarchaeia archaeon]|uniref:Nudix hydrolase domain-containing protein n=1 Tax=Candidatus Zambryskibacteria bacterium RIFCSPLOWO2_02_FULL_44_12b TaxID=1802772 RepID=A0A1G2UMS1_9BACT|nr:MAG: hypothetical protein A3H60_01025 [Candidatus Zambryskibacteria bacterium RIFCSPLOWO2_02_FULL_44_12b]HLD79243.1 NUDIX domain-containing protein [Candidatus Nanoarchaeia archaeon]
MKSILILNPDNVTKEVAATFKTRSAARGVVFDGNKNVALLPVAAHNYFKLPGGGIEEGEDKTEAFRRECLEEIGSSVEVIRKLGSVVEYRTESGLVQTSYCFVGKTIGKRKEVAFTKHEIVEGFKEPLWLSLDKAIELMANQADNYEGKFIVERDTFLLKKVKQLGIE